MTGLRSQQYNINFRVGPDYTNHRTKARPIPELAGKTQEARRCTSANGTVPAKDPALSRKKPAP